MKRGAYILVVGPTGSGKNTLIRAATEAMPSLRVAVSATTRPMRDGEIEGVSYHFLTKEEFKRREDAGEFLEWAEYGGNFYGTLRSEVVPAIDAGRVILSDIEVQGVRQVLRNLSEDERKTIYIDAGSWEELVPRIVARAPMAAEELQKRHAHYDDEASFKAEADFIVSNRSGELDAAKAAFIAIIENLQARSAEA